MGKIVSASVLISRVPNDVSNVDEMSYWFGLVRDWAIGKSLSDIVSIANKGLSFISYANRRLEFRSELLGLLRVVSEKVDELDVNHDVHRNIFVAMWFDESRSYVYDEGIKKAIDDCGFESIRIDKKQFNDDILDHIVSDIRSSMVLVADLTGCRGGVYYEAGIARGLQLCKHPIQLIFVCDAKTFREDVHFDVNHENIIQYTDTNDLYCKLCSRIGETVGRMYADGVVHD